MNRMFSLSSSMLINGSNMMKPMSGSIPMFLKTFRTVSFSSGVTPFPYLLSCVADPDSIPTNRRSNPAFLIRLRSSSFMPPSQSFLASMKTLTLATNLVFYGMVPFFFSSMILFTRSQACLVSSPMNSSSVKAITRPKDANDLISIIVLSMG